MKKLNLNNAIATTTMLTKTNTMKDKMNFFAKVVMLVAMMVMLLLNKINAAGPAYCSETGYWYAAYDGNSEHSERGSWGGPAEIRVANLSSICTPYQNKIAFQIAKAGLATGFDIEVYQSNTNGNWQIITSYGQSNIPAYDYGKGWGTKTLDINSTTRYIRFYKTRGTLDAYERCAGILLAPHVYAAQNNDTVTRNVSVTQCDQSPKEETFYLYSFLCQNACTLRIEKVSDPNNCFTCEGSYSITANSCGYTGGTDGNLKHLQDYRFTVKYTPTASGNHTATFKITDGTNESAIITVNGSCTVKQPTIQWKTLPSFETTTSPTTYKVSDYLNLTNCQIGDLTFSSSDNKAIEVYQHSDGNYYFRVNSGSTGHYDATITAEVVCGAKALFAASAQTQNIHVNKVDPTFDWSTIPQFCVANPAPQGFERSYNIPDNAFGPTGIDLKVANPTLSVPANQSLTVSGRDITVSSKAGKVNLSIALSGTNMTNAKIFTKEIFVDHYGQVMDFGRCFVLELNSPDGHTMPADVNLSNIIDATTFTSVSSSEVDFRPSLNSTSLHVDFLPSSYSTTDQASNIRNGVITVVSGNGEYHVTVKGYSVARYPTFEATKRAYYSDSVVFQNVFYDPNANTQTYISIPDNGHHYQYYNIIEGKWKMLGRRENEQSVHGFHIDNSTRDTFSLRFAPTDLWRDNQGVIAGKGSSLVIACDNDERSVFVTAQPLRYDLILDPNQSFEYIATDGQHTIDRSLFQITLPTEKRNVDCGIPDYNTDAYRNMIVFSLIDGSDVISLNGDNINVNKAGTAHILATLSPSETPDAQGKWGDVNNFEEATCTLTVNVAHAARADFEWTKPGNVMVFGSYPFSVIPAETTGVVGSVSYEVDPEGAVTIGNGQIKFNNCSTVTVKAILPETDTYERMEKTQIYTPAKVTPVLNWTQADILDKKIGDDYTFTPATWTNNAGEPAATEWANDEVTINYTSSEPLVAYVSGSKIVFERAGLTTITAAIPEEKNHNASNSKSINVKVDFDDAGINLGNEMYVGETSPLTYDITDMIVPAGALTYTTTDNDFSVDFSNNKIVVKYNPSAYHETSSGTITFTDTDGQEYHLNVTAGCVKHVPVIEWKDDKTLALSANPEMKSLNELLKNCSYCDGATIKTSDATVVMVFKSDGTPAGEGEGGTLFWARGNGEVEITIEIPETESHTSATSSETFTVSGIEDARVNWNQSLVFEYSGTQKTEPLSAVAYRMNANEPTGQKITYEIISQNPSGIVSLTQDADGDLVLSPLIINGTGTATIKAKAKATTNYAASESSVRTIIINDPASKSECTISLSEVTSSAQTYNFVLEGHDANDYYYVDKITYEYSVKGNGGFIVKGDDKNLYAKIFNNQEQVGNTKTYTGEGSRLPNPDANTGNDEITVNTPPSTQNVVTHITFSGDIGVNSSKFSKIVVTPSKYLKNTNTISHTFGSTTAIFVGQSETAQLTIAEYAFLNGNQVDMKLVNLNDDGDYAGGEFTILDKSDDDDWGKSCDYGKIKVHVQFAPLSGKDDAVHKCRIKMTGTIGTNSTSPVYFTLEGHAQRNQQQVIWTQDLSGWNSQTGEVILAASSNQSDVTGTMGYEIVSQSAATSRETTGVVDIIDGNRLKIYKAGTVTIKAKHPGDDKYLPAEWERTFTISRVDPDINLSHNSTDIAASSQIEVTLGEAPYTITGCAKYVGNVIPGYATGTGGKITFTSGATGVVSIVEDNKLKFNSAGTATITASIAEDDTVNAANITFYVKVNPSDQVVTITNDLTKKLVTTDTEDGITLTATAVNALDATMISDGTITYEIIDGTEYAEIKDGNKLVSKKNGVGNITVVAHSSQTSNYNAGNSAPVVFSMEKATPTITWTIEPEATMTFTDRMQIEATTDNDDEGAKILYVINSISGSATTSTIEGVTVIVPSQVGDIKVTPEIAGTKNYNALSATDIAKYVDITNGLVTFTIADISMRYGDPTFTITPEDGGLKGYDATYTIESGDYQYIANNNGVIPNGKIDVLNAHPGQPITVTPSFTLANYTISCAPFTVTIDKAQQSLVWNPDSIGVPALIGQDQTISAPVIGFTYQGIEDDITYQTDNNYLTVSKIPGSSGSIKIRMLQYSDNPVTIIANYLGNDNVESASTETPLSITMVLQPQKIEWVGVAPTISNIYTTNSTTEVLATLKAEALSSAFSGPTGNTAQFKAEISDNCPSTANLVVLTDNGDNSYSVKYTGNGSGHVKITAYAEKGNGYEHTKPEDEKTIEFDVLLSPATVSWTTNEFADAHYGDLITMTPDISPDLGNKEFTYAFEEDKQLSCSGNVLSVNDVATEGTTITARNTADCFVEADADGFARSGIVINPTPQAIVWNQTLDNIDAGDYSDTPLTISLNAYSKDTRHSLTTAGGSGVNTCLTIEESGEVLTGLGITYTVNFVPDIDGCDFQYSVSDAGILSITNAVAGTVEITASCTDPSLHYSDATVITKSFNIVLLGTTVVASINNGQPVAYDENVTYDISATASAGSLSYSDVSDFTYEIISGTDVVSINGNKITTLKAGTATVKVTKDGNCMITKGSYDLVFTVDSAIRTIVWNNTSLTLTTASPDVSLDAYTIDSHSAKLSDEGVYELVSADDIKNTSPSLKCVELDSDNKKLVINGSGNAKLKVTFSGSDKYKTVSQIWDIDIIDGEPLLISVTDPEVGTITSTDENVDMWEYFSVTNYTGETIVKIKSVSQPVGLDDVLTINGNQFMTVMTEAETETVQVPCTVTVTSRYLADGTHPTATGYITFSISKGTLIFNVTEESGDNKWTNPANWSRYDIMELHTDGNLLEYNVAIADSCFIGKDVAEDVSDETEFLGHTVNAACHDLTIDGTDAKLVIGEASTLNVVGNLTNSAADRLVLTANKWGQASVAFGNDAEHGNPMATIEMYIPKGNGSNTDPIWQYRGISVSDFKPAGGPWPCMAIFRWDESFNNNAEQGCWQRVTNGGGIPGENSLTPWTGYAFANICSTDSLKEENWLSYTGRLINTEQNIPLSYNRNTITANENDTFANVGMNLITNSYTVPLLISELGYPAAKCEKGVVLYYAGSYSQYMKTGTDAGNVRAGNPGQYSTVPSSTGEVATDITTIPAGQSFFVKALAKDSSLNIKYGNDYYVMSPSDMMYMPGRDLKPEYNLLKIRVVANSDSVSDVVALLECDSCTRQYDNGYDGKKVFGNEGLPQIYAYNKYGITSVNADSSFNKQFVGFNAGSDDETYTLSFETDRLFGYHSLYLIDRKLNQSIDILANETYSFKGYSVGENMRFQINGITEEEWNNQKPDDDPDDESEDGGYSNVCDLRVISGNMLYVEGFTADEYPAANIEIFDMAGNMIWSTPLTPIRFYDLPALPKGIYTVRLGDCHVKYMSIF